MCTAKSFIATACVATGVGVLLSKVGPSSWTQYVRNYTAGTTRPILSFGFRGTATTTNYLDGISVVDVIAPSVELLRNPSFENSSSTATGWTTWCHASCTGSSDQGRVTNTGCRTGSGNNCYEANCEVGIDFLAQAFTAIVGHVYTISFWLHQNGNSTLLAVDTYY